MKILRLTLTLFCALLLSALTACSSASKAPDVTGSIRTSLDREGLKNVSVKQDREKGVVTLAGKVATDSEKVQAESIAKSEAGGQVVANEIGVVTPGAE